MVKTFENKQTSELSDQLQFKKRPLSVLKTGWGLVFGV
jgi:hypothetical protein